MGKTHIPVLAEEVLAALNIDPQGVYLDATYGRGGHSELIVSQLGPEGKLLVIDRDPTAIKDASERFGADPRVTIRQAEFASLDDVMTESLPGLRLNGVLFDLGVSSPQLDEADRGFSFSKTGPLDMRMGFDRGQPASEWLASVSERDLVDVLKRYGEERQARRVAAAIVAARAVRAIDTTTDLVDIILGVIAIRPGKIHPATRTFQAIRIAINDELNQISEALAVIVDQLAGAGRLAVISFQSLEDRIVKRFIRNASLVPAPYRGLPDIPDEYQAKLRPVGRLVRATDAEIARNPRSRSARLRIAERVAA